MRPRLLTTIDGRQLEALLSPPMPWTSRPVALDPQPAAAERLTGAASAALETEAARLGTSTWPQLELRVAVGLPLRLRMVCDPGAFTAGMQPVVS